MVFLLENRKSEHLHWTLHIQISLESVTKIIETYYTFMKKS